MGEEKNGKQEATRRLGRLTAKRGDRNPGPPLSATVAPLIANSNEGNSCGVCVAGIAAGIGGGAAIGAIPGNRTVYRTTK